MGPTRCPAGHTVRDPWTLRCPTCGRLLAQRFVRTCPNGHAVAGPLRLCPVCGEEIESHRAAHIAAGVVLAVFALLMLYANAAEIPERITASGRGLYDAIRELILNSPLYAG